MLGAARLAKTRVPNISPLTRGNEGELVVVDGLSDPGNAGLHTKDLAQEEMAAFHRFEENLHHFHCAVSKEA